MTEAFAALHARDPRGSPDGLAWLLQHGDAKLDENTVLLKAYEHSQHGKKRSLSGLSPRDLEATVTRHAEELGLAAHAHIANQAKEWQQVQGFPTHGRRGLQLAFALNALYAADPTTEQNSAGQVYGSNVPHLMRWLQCGEQPMLPEDLPGAKRDLIKLARHKDELNANKPENEPRVEELDQYPAIQALRATVPLNSATMAEREKFEAEAIKAGAELIGQGPNWMVLHLATPQSALKAGQETSWCTAIRNPRANHYARYSKNLTYLRLDQDVFQLHLDSGQVRDMNDGEAHHLLHGLCSRQPEIARPLMDSLMGYRLPAAPGKADYLEHIEDCSQQGLMRQMGIVVTLADSMPDQGIKAVLQEKKRVIQGGLLRAAQKGWGHEVAYTMTLAQQSKDFSQIIMPTLLAHLEDATFTLCNEGDCSGLAKVIIAAKGHAGMMERVERTRDMDRCILTAYGEGMVTEIVELGKAVRDNPLLRSAYLTGTDPANSNLWYLANRPEISEIRTILLAERAEHQRTRRCPKQSQNAVTKNPPQRLAPQRVD